MSYYYLWKFLLELFLNNISKEKKGFYKKNYL